MPGVSDVYKRQGLDYATGLMPAVGFALLLRMMWSKQMAVYFFLGVVLVSFFNIPIIGVACVGIILAVILILNEKTETAAVQAADNGEEELFND